MGNFDKFEKRRGGKGFGGGSRPMFKAICTKCGQNCEVPFKPTSDRPVFCNSCFKNKGNVGSGPQSAPKNFGGGNNINAGNAVTRGQFDALNAKLDKIISLLSVSKPVEAPKVKPLEIKEIIKKVKTAAKKAKSKRK